MRAKRVGLVCKDLILTMDFMAISQLFLFFPAHKGSVMASGVGCRNTFSGMIWFLRRNGAEMEPVVAYKIGTLSSQDGNATEDVD